MDVMRKGRLSKPKQDRLQEYLCLELQHDARLHLLA